MPRARKLYAAPGGARLDGHSTAALLELRLCDLDLRLEGSWLEEMTQRVKGELEARGLETFRPHFWIADEWFCPDGVPGVAIPFYLAHPRLIKLERDKMLEVEGGTRTQCARLLRHELGHAIQNAYQLQRRRRWQELFGKASTPYPESYRPNPASKRFVQHLDGYYAQSHPVEDFAETFALWLAPRSNWRKVYQGWPALKKLEYVDELMDEVADQPPKAKSRARPYALRQLRFTLDEHYRRKRNHYTIGFTDAWDRDLERLFDSRGDKGAEPAAAFLRRHRKEIREMVVRWTGDHTFTVDQVLREMIGRCRELNLRTRPTLQRKTDFAILLTVHSMNYVYRGREWRAL